MSDPTERAHPHTRLDSHDERLTDLEKFRERVKGGLLVLSILVGSGIFTSVIITFIGF